MGFLPFDFVLPWRLLRRLLRYTLASEVLWSTALSELGRLFCLFFLPPLIALGGEIFCCLFAPGIDFPGVQLRRSAGGTQVIYSLALLVLGMFPSHRTGQPLVLPLTRGMDPGSYPLGLPVCLLFRFASGLFPWPGAAVGTWLSVIEFVCYGSSGIVSSPLGLIPARPLSPGPVSVMLRLALPDLIISWCLTSRCLQPYGPFL